MTSFRPFRAADLLELVVQPRHELHRRELAGTPQSTLLEGPDAWTAADAYGRPIACGGIFDGVAWAYLGPDLRRHMVAITRHVRGVLAAHPGPIEVEIDEEFPEAVRWAGLLGLHRVALGRWEYAL